MDHLPLPNLRRSVDRYKEHRFVKSLSCQNQFRSMAFAQLTSRDSLRDIKTCLGVQHRKLFHRGFRRPVFAIHWRMRMRNVMGAVMQTLRSP